MKKYTIEDIEKCVENWGMCKVEKEYIEKFLQKQALIDLMKLDEQPSQEEVKCEGYVKSTNPKDPYCSKCREYKWQHQPIQAVEERALIEYPIDEPMGKNDELYSQSINQSRVLQRQAYIKGATDNK